MHVERLEPKALGQLLLMQNMALNLPNINSIISFVCRGLKDIPGVENVFASKENVNNKEHAGSIIYIPIEQNDMSYGGLVIQLNNPEEFAPYLDYVNNFVFMLGVIFEERTQRSRNKQYQQELEIALQKQKEISKELENVNKELHQKNIIIGEKNEELNKNIKQLKETQLQLLQSEKMASLGILTAGVSHEINNPLQFLSGVYSGFADYFNEYGSKDENTTSFLLQSAETAISRISSIVKGLNQLNRDNSNYDEDCDINAIITNCITILKYQTKHKIKINRNFCPDNISVRGNVGKLHQVFINLLTNSIQSIVENGEISISTFLVENNLIVEISDTGCGISKSDIAKITEPFYTTKEPGKGTGLGLSIAYSIIKDHNGKIKFESKENQGTKVTITLALQQ